MADEFEKWLTNTRKRQGGLHAEGARREAENEAARSKLQKLDELKDYEKAQRTQAAKSAKLRERRLAKEAQDREDAAKRKTAAVRPSRRKSP
jgi:hypothetical protein